VFVPSSPYNALPMLPPTVELQTTAVLKSCILARVAMAELRTAGELIPNQAVLINTIPLLESQASSEIENIVTTTDDLFRLAQLNDLGGDPAAKEALRYRQALNEGFRALEHRPLSTETAIQVCSRIKNIEMQVRRIPGTTLRNFADGEIVYTPPVGETLLQEKLSNWERFLHESPELDPLIRMAVAHYQFEAIHPFTDGNGRTGRILNLLMLVSDGLLREPVLYLSRYILANRAEYYRLLQRVTAERDWETWIIFVLTAVASTAQWTTQKIHAISALQREAIRFVQDETPRHYSRELVDALFVQPYCRIETLVRDGIGTRQTSALHLKRLVGIGMLREIRIGREKLFLHQRFLDLLLRDSNEVPPYAPTVA
jgi:Fic family protein